MWLPWLLALLTLRVRLFFCRHVSMYQLSKEIWLIVESRKGMMLDLPGCTRT